MDFSDQSKKIPSSFKRLDLPDTPGKVNPALQLVLEQESQTDAQVPSYLELNYPDEMNKPAIRRLCDYYSLIDTYSLHKEALRSSGLGGRSFLYGDTPPPVIYRLLTHLNADSNDIFLDLGCGCGTAVFTASLLVKLAVGVDLVPAVIDFCHLSQQSLGLFNTQFKVEDLLKTDIRQATIIYAASTAFDFLDHLRHKLLEASPGTLIITVTHEVTCADIELIETYHMLLAWNKGNEAYPFKFFVHRRI